MSLQIQWHERKATANLRKHGVSFEEAATIFGDPLSRTVPDDRHNSAIEERFVTIGTSFRNRLLVVIHLDDGSRIRLISARRPTARERRSNEND